MTAPNLIGGQDSRQTTSNDKTHCVVGLLVPGQSASGVAASGLPPVLLTKEQAAAHLGVSKGLFETMRLEPWMPRPVVMGQRVLRWIRSELDQAIVELPRQAAPERQPAQLRRAKIERMKATGAAA